MDTQSQATVRQPNPKKTRTSDSVGDARAYATISRAQWDDFRTLTIRRFRRPAHLEESGERDAVPDVSDAVARLTGERGILDGETVALEPKDVRSSVSHRTTTGLSQSRLE